MRQSVSLVAVPAVQVRRFAELVAKPALLDKPAQTDLARLDGDQHTQMLIAYAYQQTAKEHARNPRDGVVVTPVEVADYLAQSALQQAEKHDWGGVLDPFTGTGIIPARMIQLAPAKHRHKLVAGLIVQDLDPLAVWVAATNLGGICQNLGIITRPQVRIGDSFDTTRAVTTFTFT